MTPAVPRTDFYFTQFTKPGSAVGFRANNSCRAIDRFSPTVEVGNAVGIDCRNLPDSVFSVISAPHVHKVFMNDPVLCIRLAKLEYHDDAPSTHDRLLGRWIKIINER